MPPEGSVLNIEELEARNGDVYINGHVHTANVKAKRVFFNEGYLKADRIDGEQEVHLKGQRFQVLYTHCPSVTIDAEAKGLALVVDCKHEVPEGKFMGGFPNMEEAKKTFQSFMDLFGGAETAAAAAAGGQGDKADEGTQEEIKKFFQKK
jgi:hypothetical protein